jgi:F-type H+-transporting ATPase subunit delta
MKAVRLYAQVLVDVALAPSSGLDLAKISSELDSFRALLDSSEMALKTLDSPVVSDDEKQKTLKVLCEKIGIGPVAARFLAMLNKRGRLSLLAGILKEVETLQIERKGGVVGELVSAVPVDGPILAGLTDALTKQMKKPVSLSTKVDASLIAGMKITIGGVTYDGSVRSKLDKIANQA